MSTETEPVDFELPWITSTKPHEQRIQFLQGIQMLSKQRGSPVLLRRGSHLYFPTDDGLGAYRAKKADLDLFVSENFIVAESEIGEGGARQIKKRMKLNASLVKTLLDRPPEELPVYGGETSVPLVLPHEWVEVEDDGQEIHHKDVRLLSKPGYDAESTLFYDPPKALQGVDFSQDFFPDARAAYEFLRFTWAKDLELGDGSQALNDTPSEAHFLAALLTPFVREQVGIYPGFLFFAKDVSAGKSFWAERIQEIVTGRSSELSSVPRTESELTWAIAAVLGLPKPPAIIIMDNIKHSLSSGALDSLLVSRKWGGRGVGAGYAYYDNDAVWFFTGNNVTMDADSLQRFIPIFIRKSEAARFADYTHANMTGWIFENRSMILRAVFQILRAGQNRVSGDTERPPTHDKYSRWVSVMWDCCMAVGLTGFMQERASDMARTMEDEQAIELMRRLFVLHPDGFTANDVKDMIFKAQEHAPDEFCGFRFLDSIKQPGSVTQVLNPKLFASWVREFGSFSRDGYTIVRLGKREDGVHYKVVKQ